MLAELVDHVIGIDPDRDWITAAVGRAPWGGGNRCCDSWWRQVMASVPSSGAMSVSRVV